MQDEDRSSTATVAIVAIIAIILILGGLFYFFSKPVATTSKDYNVNIEAPKTTPSTTINQPTNPSTSSTEKSSTTSTSTTKER